MTLPRPAEPEPRALGESLAALAAQLADLRGQICAINNRLDHAGLHPGLNLAARFEDLAHAVAGRPGGRGPSRSGRPLLDWPRPGHLPRAAGRPAALGRHRVPPTLRRLRPAGVLAAPHPCHLGTVHPRSRMAPHLQRDAPGSGPGAGVLRPLAARRYAPYQRHDPRMHAALRDAPHRLRLGKSSRVSLMPVPGTRPFIRSGMAVFGGYRAGRG
jgi:hypothetical protein